MGTYEIQHGDIFDSDVDALVNTVNCKGVMGRGLALEFKRRFPANYDEYRAECEAGRMLLGRVHVFSTGRMSPRYVFNFPTKDHWRGRSELANIASGLASLANEVKNRGVKSIAIPALGCDLGGLDWDEVRPMIVATIDRLDGVHALLFAPRPEVREQLVTPKDGIRMTRARAVVTSLMATYRDAGVGLLITNLEVQKLMYFAQMAGEELQLEHKKGRFGPYAGKLRFVLRDMSGKYIAGYKEVGDLPGDELRLLEGAETEANEWLASRDETKARLVRVAKLVDGYESQFGLEVLSTVHWVARDMESPTLNDVADRVWGWNHRKRDMIDLWHIEMCLNRLVEQGWVGSTPGA